MLKKILKFTGILVLVLAVLVIGVFLYVSSGHFIQAQVLPRVADELGMDVVAGDVTFSALSELELRNLRVGSEADPLLRAKTIRVRYRALSLLSRKVEVSEVLLDEVTVTATPEKLAAFRQPAEKTEAQPASSEPESARSAAPPEILIGPVSIHNLAVSYVDSTGMDVQVPQFNLELPRLAGGSDFHLTIETQAKIVSGADMNAAIGQITLDLQGALGLDLLPTQVKLAVHFEDITGSAGPVSLDGRRMQLAAELDGDARHYELRQLEISEFNGGIKDASAGVTGTFSLEPLAASLDPVVDLPAGSLLNGVGALAGGLDFGRTAIAYKGHIEMTPAGQLASDGDLSIRDLSVAVPASGVQAMRPLQVSARHRVSMDLPGQSLTLSQLKAAVEDRGRKVIDLELNQPMTLELNNTGDDASAQLAVRVDRLDLTMLNALLAGQPDLRILSGEVNRVVDINIRQGGKLVAVNVGGGGVDKLVVQQGDRRIGPLRINHEAGIELTKFNELNLKRFHVELVPLAAGTAPAATLDLSGNLVLAPEPNGTLNAVVSGSGNRLLVLAKPFIPPETEIRRLAGSFKLDSTIQLAGTDPVRLESAADLEGIDFALADGTALASPVSSVLDLKLDYAAGGIAKVERLGLVLRRPGAKDTLLDLEASGSFDTTMNPGVKNTLNAATHGRIPLDELETLVVRPAAKPSSAPSGPVESVPASPPPNLWIETSLVVEQAVYREMQISNLLVKATYRNGQVELAEVSAAVNEGSARASGTCDLANPAKPVYDLAITGSGLEFAPVLASFAPHALFYPTGGLKTAAVRLNGEGFDLASLQKNLTADVNVQLDQLAIQRLGGALGQLTETLLLGIFNLGMKDMVFADGGLELAIDSNRYGDNDIHIEQLLLRAPLFMLDGKGTVGFGGKWLPDIELKTGFSDGKAASLNRQGFSIASEASPSGYHAGPAIPLKGDLMNLFNQASLVTQTLVNAGKISAEDAMKADLANQVLGVLTGEGGGLDGLFGGGKNGDVGGTLGNILQGVLGSQEKKDSTDQDKKKQDDPVEAIGNVLQGLFGN